MADTSLERQRDDLLNTIRDAWDWWQAHRENIDHQMYAAFNDQIKAKIAHVYLLGYRDADHEGYYDTDKSLKPPSYLTAMEWEAAGWDQA